MIDHSARSQEKGLGTSHLPPTSLNRQSRFKLAWLIGGMLIVIAIIGLLVHGFSLTSSTRTKADPTKVEIVPITTAKATIATLPLEIRNIGNVEAYSVVNVSAQVGGQLMGVYFKQGDDVKKGQLLFQIDPRPYKAQLDQAEANVVRDRSQIKSAVANLAKDQALEKQARANLERDLAQKRYADVQVTRYNVLVEQGAVSREQSDQIRTNSDTTSATVSSDRAAVENAEAVVKSDLAAVQTAKATLAAETSAADNLRIQLGFTEIRSPLDGRTGSLNVYPGNVVKANDTTPLVTIHQISPIYVTFSVPESNLNNIRQAIQQGHLAVTALIGGDQHHGIQGTLSFIDNTVDKTTGAIKLKATFPNQDRLLWPGQFVNVIVRMPSPSPSVVIPSRAIENDQQGQSVFRVKPNNTVEFVAIEVERTFSLYSVVKNGLRAGDIIVTDGQLKLTPGARVKVQKQDFVQSPKEASISP